MSAAATATPSWWCSGKNVTPNLHALVTRFPLLDRVFANSEASIQGHFWTAAASVPDYVDRNWVQEYAGRGRPNDFGVYAVTFPGNGFLFDQAERQHISYFNYGEGIAGDEPTVPDRDRSAALLEEEERVAANSDLGPGLTPGGTYPSDLTIGRHGADRRPARRRDLRLQPPGRRSGGQLLPHRQLPRAVRRANSLPTPSRRSTTSA